MTSVTMLLSGVTSGYPVKNSLRFRSSASAYLSRTPASAGNSQKFTLSFWTKRGIINGGASYSILEAGYSSAPWLYIGFQNDNLYLSYTAGVSSTGQVISTAVYRDPSAWYHIVYAVDTTQATAANRVIIYVNGVQITSFSQATYPTQNQSIFWNSITPHQIGGYSGNFYDGYLAEFNSIDGQQLTPSYFGTYDANGVWQPIKYSGSFGTNGFYLNFGNTTSTTTLGYDTSGNSNNWTTNNISLTAGSTYDSMTDSPTVSSATVANYAVLNPVAGATTDSLTNGNLNVSGTSTTAANFVSTMAIPLTGKWYWEVTYNGTTGTLRDCLGMVQTPNNGSTMPDQYNDTSWVFIYSALGLLRQYNQSTVATYSTISSGQTIGISFDSATGKVWLNINGTYANSGNPTAGTGQVLTINTGVNWFPTLGDYGNNANSSVNFGQCPFALTVPSGFKALNTYNLPTPTIANGAQYMAATTYTGTGATQTISDGGNNTIGTTFQPDLVWIKSRSAATSNLLYDVIRGTTNYIQTNATTANTANANTLTAFGSTGFTLGSDASAIGVNVSAATYVGWQWKGGGTGVSNTAGSITSTVSANTTAGFSVVGFTSTQANSTIGHGLGVAPSMIIFKNYASGTTNWPVYHSSLPATQYLFINATSAATTDSTMFNSTAPTSSVFSTGTNPNFAPGTTIAYCFAAVPGYSAFGSYTGNGSTDGPFAYVGFRPRFIMLKRTDSGPSQWWIMDTSRSPYNVSQIILDANQSSAENTGSTDTYIDILSNGFKLRSGYTDINASGGTYIYAAFAESPFNTARAR